MNATNAQPTYTWTIETAKGGTTGTAREIAEWQAEHQGSFAKVTCAWTHNDNDYSVEIDADDIDFDADNIDGAVTALRNGRDWEIDALGTDDDRAEAGC
jgi:hypothetical protein